MEKSNHAPLEFHVSRQARDKYQLDVPLFSTSGNVVFANFHAARVFAQKMNQRRDLVRFPEQAVRAGQINAMGLIDEILHMVISLYRQQRKPEVMREALDWLNERVGQAEVDKALTHFVRDFPPRSVYQREESVEDYLAGSSTIATGPGGQETSVSNKQIALEEMIMLWLANANPAFSPFIELFDDTDLEKQTAYPEIISSLHSFFDLQPPFGPENQNLIDMLRSPAINVPHSLSGQLEFIRQRWGALLGRFLYRLLSSLDLIREEEKAIFLGPGPARIYEFAGMEMEPERFSQDKDWMPSLVLIAKNTYVWLDQLSKTYERNIYRLDQIPDEELDKLARWGFTGLWLIGIWERSQASQRIKQLRGNPEAVASAYSLFEYTIAGDLGGEQAFQDLRERAWKRGIRLASDMVPNHMGIDSRWVIEHPDWFINLPYSPFPSYTFNGPNLSWDSRVAIYLEDHYYNNTDAAVVFKRVDVWTGDSKYIYHGNDGTSMPWNDTAQLNYLLPEVREAVIQTILSVARRFPIIRFDAAMTLAKKHYQRLWFPEPGTGGAIPSRAEHGLTKEQFDQLFPVEFWREVVDRVAQEVPDTLLLAEAFWLMEGYFVRTLGMHRVYNSAFMNMMRDEKNAEYRLVIKNTVEFDPEILKRYVNFMNNPDERTAVDQFGKDDKYFGVCTVMVTMPGLPMFGHGQIQGFTEKYGMEYRKAYWDETPDQYLIERHEREIFPLLRKRYLFAQVADFLLYDFFTPEGTVNEDVFAYSNKAGDERSLVIYHNRFATARGWIRTSAAYSVKNEQGERILVQKSLAEGLGLNNDDQVYTIFRDHITGLEYIRNNRELVDQGLFIELEAYKYHVFLDFRQVTDNEWRQYSQLATYLNGMGVPSIDEALKEIFLQPVHYPFRELINAGFFNWAIDNRSGAEKSTEENQQAVFQEAADKYSLLVSEIQHLTESQADLRPVIDSVVQELEVALHLPAIENHYPAMKDEQHKNALHYLLPGREGDLPLISGLVNGYPLVWGTLLTWIFTHRLGEATGSSDASEITRSWIDEWLLGKIIAGALIDLGLDERLSWRQVSLLKLMIAHQDWCQCLQEEEISPAQVLRRWLQDGEVRSYLGINRYQGVLWFNKESFDDLVWWLYLVSIMDMAAAANQEAVRTAGKNSGETGTAAEAQTGAFSTQLETCYHTVEALLQAEAKSDYQLEKLIEALED